MDKCAHNPRQFCIVLIDSLTIDNLEIHLDNLVILKTTLNLIELKIEKYKIILNISLKFEVLSNLNSP